MPWPRQMQIIQKVSITRSGMKLFVCSNRRRRQSAMPVASRRPCSRRDSTSRSATTRPSSLCDAVTNEDCSMCWLGRRYRRDWRYSTPSRSGLGPWATDEGESPARTMRGRGRIAMMRLEATIGKFERGRSGDRIQKGGWELSNSPGWSVNEDVTMKIHMWIPALVVGAVIRRRDRHGWILETSSGISAPACAFLLE
jgi:hypothetical protein